MEPSGGMMKRCQMNIKDAQGSREHEGFVEN